MSYKQVYPDDELIRQWSHKVQPSRCIAFNENQPGPPIEWVRAMLAEVVDWARVQTARECEAVCASRKAMHEREGHAGSFTSEADRCAEAIRAAFNIKQEEGK